MNAVTTADITDAVRRLGAGAGDLLVVHSSLSSFGHVVGGAPAVASALVGSVSAGGCVFVPTFTYGRPAFDPRTTPSLNGAVTEAVRALPGATRSRHPTHSWAGVGPAAGEVLAGHERTHAFGVDSPLWRLWQANAWILLVGVDHRTNSMIHVAEESVGAAYLDRTRVAQVIQDDGTTADVEVRRPGCSKGFNKLDAPLRARGAIREARVGDSRLMLMRSADVVEAAAEMLRRDAAALLCEVPNCDVCRQARELIVAADV